MTLSPRASVLAASIAVALMSSACSAEGEPAWVAPASVQAAAASPGSTPGASTSMTPAAAPSASSRTPASTLPDGVTALDAGLHVAQVMGTGTYPGYTAMVPDGWYDLGGHFVINPTDNATYSQDTTVADREELEQIVESLRFVAP